MWLVANIRHGTHLHQKCAYGSGHRSSSWASHTTKFRNQVYCLPHVPMTNLSLVGPIAGTIVCHQTWRQPEPCVEPLWYKKTTTMCNSRLTPGNFTLWCKTNTVCSHLAKMESSNGRQLLLLRIIKWVGGVAGFLRHDVCNLVARLAGPVGRRECEATVSACIQRTHL